MTVRVISQWMPMAGWRDDRRRACALCVAGHADHPSATGRAQPAGRRFLDQSPQDIAIAEGRLFGIRLDGKWMHIGTPEAQTEAEALLAARDAVP
jgi:hypothetical protein